MEFLVGHFNYFIYITLMMVGFYAMVGKKNLVKKLVGMNIFQWSIILFFVSIGAKHGGNIPIIDAGHGHNAAELVIESANYVNPLPHVLMLTAIVVGVGTTGVSLALLLTLYKKYGTLEEDEIIRKL
ncbi:MAG: cation:proton antiporter subunit C [Myxococcota bacterium]|nr:cation:proton antiporter subunit C [Myxococcota bacterium]